MKIGFFLPAFVKDEIREVLKKHGMDTVLKHTDVNSLIFAYRRRGIGNFGSDEVTGEKFLIEHVLTGILNTDSPVLFDVGANVGHYAKTLRIAFPKARISAFEPVPSTFETLRLTMSDSAVDCFPFALSDRDGTSLIYDYDQKDGSEHASLFAGVFEDLHQAKHIKGISVSLTTLDSFCIKEGISRIDFLKIDTEGNELKVLQGARSMIQSNAIRSIQFEFNEMNVVARVYLRDFYEILNGFSFYRLLPKGLLPLGKYSPLNEIFLYQNIVALNDAAIDKYALAPFIVNLAN